MDNARLVPLPGPGFRVDFLAASDLPFPGRVGLCRAPGTREETGSRASRTLLEVDLRYLREGLDVRTLVTLQEHAELELLGARDLFARAGAAGLECLSFPIPDGFPPFSMAGAFALVDAIYRRLSAGQAVAIHCYAGLGRTGTVAATLLAAQGVDPKLAMARVREVRPGSIPGRLQERFVEAFADAWNGVFDGEDPVEQVVSMSG